MKIKQDLLEYYEGDTTDQYVAIVDKTLQSKGKLVNKLAANWFLRVFFNGIHIDYTKKLEIEKNVFFQPIAKIEDLEFLITQKTEPLTDDFYRIIVNQKRLFSR
ncbi:hypothetical protein FNW52_09215 [Flavobacterium sp. ZT3R18]|nr:hypothetical protein FNW52_09215 [Flavobacterium sp. ZT3R18]